ncbi:MAG: phosphoribosyltransferase family protein [Peptoniphilaceae bacterium]|nr:phosphoribosyltransferase family protein [Peptoniphilaceae bacterium]MDY6018508.1 phosphoribosyltransferase family protein [Anaerococcus sp.]
MKTYKLKVAGLERDLPIIKISDALSIASFVILGDQELTTKSAKELDKLIPDVDIFVTAEAKGIPLVHELSRLRNMKKYVVCRKSVKSYMKDSIEVSLKSITTANSQKLYLNGEDVGLIKGKEVCLVDDVISTGQSSKALEELINKAGGIVVARAAILAEGEAYKRDDIIYLSPLPLNPEK